MKKQRMWVAVLGGRGPSGENPRNVLNGGTGEEGLKIGRGRNHPNIVNQLYAIKLKKIIKNKFIGNGLKKKKKLAMDYFPPGSAESWLVLA